MRALKDCVGRVGGTENTPLSLVVPLFFGLFGDAGNGVLRQRFSCSFPILCITFSFV